MLTLTDTTGDAVMKLSQGNPGAVLVCCELLKEEHGLMLLLDLDDMGMKGSSIWLGYKDHCKQDIKAFATAVRSRDAAMIATIKRNGGEAWAGGKS